MNNEEFIKNAVANALEREGYSWGESTTYAKDAVNHFHTAKRFNKSAYADCLAYAKKMAKQGVRK